MEASFLLMLSSVAQVQNAIDDRRGILLLSFASFCCQSCKNLTPILANADKSYADRLRALKGDIEASPEDARQFGTRGVPTTLLSRHGGKHSRFAGSNLIADRRNGFALRGSSWVASTGLTLAAPSSAIRP